MMKLVPLVLSFLGIFAMLVSLEARRDRVPCLLFGAASIILIVAAIWVGVHQ